MYGNIMKDIHFNKQMLLGIIGRFHLVIFFVTTVLLLSIAVLLLSSIVNKASGLDSTPTNTASSNFDQSTIDRIDKLKTSDEPSQPLDLSKGRINPFSE